MAKKQLKLQSIERTSKMRVQVDWSDGVYSWWKIKSKYEKNYIEVPASTVQLWEAIDKLNKTMQQQLKDLDNENFEK